VTANLTAEPIGTPSSGQPADRPLRYQNLRLDGSVREFHTVDALQADTVPYTHYLKVLAGHADRTAAER
jgi:hypothetical protein